MQFEFFLLFGNYNTTIVLALVAVAIHIEGGFNVYQGTATMPQSPSGKLSDEAVRLSGDVVRLARIITAVDGGQLGRYLSDILRPVLLKRIHEIESEGLVPKPTGKKKP